ncbi:MAG: flagellar biosynthesis anti-sigma factor FlgM [Fibrobacteres bacterium]|nr:flagellar biosynthesis anti-sigma factor FlgM [Fibrobacterota bacterium]
MSIEQISGQPVFNAYRAESEIKTEKDKKNASAPVRQDSVDSWKNAENEDANRKSIIAFAKAAQDIREDRLAEVKERVYSGFYNTEAAADSIADKLIG